MTLIGRIICKLRELTGRKPVHDYIRCKMVLEAGNDKSEEIAVRVCRRCDHFVPVKTRGPRKAKP